MMTNPRIITTTNIRIITIFGRTCTGKTTLAKLPAEKYNALYLGSVAYMLPETSALGQMARRLIAAGRLIDESIIWGIINDPRRHMYNRRISAHDGSDEIFIV
jgi:adenylate kinase family enzyme